MKILTDNKFVNYTLIASVGLLVVFMLSSFILRTTSTPISSNVASDKELKASEQKIQVNILNATGEKGLASEMRTYLMSLGFDVLSIGNYPTKEDKSIVIGRQLGDTTSAYKVANAVGVSRDYVTDEFDAEAYWHATIVIGSDYRELKNFAVNIASK